METHKLAKELNWKVGVDYPEWGNNRLYLTTIRGSYLRKGESPKEAYDRISKVASDRLNKPELKDRFFDILWKGWLIPSTPVMANLGTETGLPISCFSSYVGDTMYDIGRKVTEFMMVSKHGGGYAFDISGVRPIGAKIKNGEGGTSDGIIPFLKIFDSAVLASKQGNTRRGASAVYLDVNHAEIKEFLKIRQPKGEINRQCLNLHHGVTIDDEFMTKVENRDPKSVELWKEILKTRVEKGEPYIFFKDVANNSRPINWKQNELTIRQSNLCSEIMLPTDENHSLVCCLSSLNLAKFDEWKESDTVYLSILFLDAVMEEFIQKAKNIQGIEDTVRFAIKSRALGLSVLGWHSYLQQQGVPFVGIQSNSLTRIVFKHIQDEATRATEYLAQEYGEPEWMKGTGQRNLTLTTVAPTRSSSKLAGDVSQGIEPIMSNLYLDDDAKGNHIRRNPNLERVLESKGKNTNEIWDSISETGGSVQHLSCLNKEEKELFLTFREINQLELVRQASIRQKYIDQSQSLNLAFFNDAPAKFINKVHFEAWKLGIKSLYYMRSESALKLTGGSNYKDLYSECLMCEA